MIKNYFTTTVRKLLRNKTYALINVLGLALSIACCLMIFLVVRFELSFDTFHQKADRIYRVNTRFLGPDGGQTAGAPYPIAKALQAEFPEIENVTTSNFEGEGLIKVDNNLYKETGIALVAPSFFEIFDFQWEAGNPKKALSEPYSVVLTETLARKYFSNQAEAIGKVIRFNNQHDLRVTGVLKDFPSNTDFPFTVLVSMATLEAIAGEELQSWTNISSSVGHFILLKEKQDYRKLEQQLRAFEKKYKGEKEASKSTHVLQPLLEMHYDSRFSNYNDHVFAKETLWVLVAIGIFLLLAACINFVNLATAQSIKRSREVGVRKVLGATRGQLIGQLMAETVCLTTLAAIVTVLLAKLFFPQVEQLLDQKIGFSPLSDPTIILFLIFLTIVVSILSGLYPALVLSGYQPVLALKNKINTHRTGGISLRRGLIVLQFSISQVLIIGTLVISAQLDYFHNKPLGFNKEAIVMVSLPETPGKEVTTLRTQLNNLPGIQNVSFTAYAPSSRSSWWAPFTYESLGTDQEIVTEMRPADHTYIQTFGLQLLAGQDLRENGDSSEVVVNESLIHKMNIPNPADAIGKRVTMFDQKLTIVGVVKDFHSHSLRDNINQVMLMKRPFVRTAAIKLYLQNTGQTISQIEHIWKQTFPDHLFEYDFLDEQLNKFYQEEEKAAQLFHIFSGIAIFIGCLGLFGLVSFMAIQRTKEVGIRKALGASAMQIIALFYKEFVFLIALAFLIASPVAWFMMNRWLENFTYRINIGVDTFLIAIASSIAIALLTVSYQSIKAARANPVKSLRSE